MAIRYIDSQTLYSDTTVSFNGKKTYYVTLSASVSIAPFSVKRSARLATGSMALLSFFPNREIRAVASLVLGLALGYNKTVKLHRTLSALANIVSGVNKRLFSVEKAVIATAASLSKHDRRVRSAAIQLSPSVETAVVTSNSAALTILSDIIKKIDKVLSADLSMSSDKEDVEGELLEATLSVSASAAVFIKKKLSTDVSFEIDALILTDKQSEYAVRLKLFAYPKPRKRTYKVLEATVQISSYQAAAHDEEHGSSLDISAETLFFINKEFNSTLGLVGEGAKQIEGEADSMLMIAGDLDKSVSKTVSSSMMLAGFEEEGTQGVADATLSVSAETEAFIAKTINSTISLSSDGGVSSAKEAMLGSTISLVAEKSRKFIAKYIHLWGGDGGETLVLTASSSQMLVKTLPVSLSMGASVDIFFNGSLYKEITIYLVDERAVKRVGKTFTIREHTPSVWHNC